MICTPAGVIVLVSKTPTFKDRVSVYKVGL